MVTYKSRPVVKAVVGGVTFEGEDLLRGQVIRVENGFDTCTLDFNDYKSKNYPGNINCDAGGDPVELYFKDASEAGWIKVFHGVIRFMHLLMPTETLRLKCDGRGRGFTEEVCAEEYGVQSSNPTLDTIKEILEDATNGIVDKWVEKLLGTATDTGFTYTTEVENIAGTIQYLYFPYKPCSKCLDDLVDIVQAIKGASAGPHWLVTPDAKLIVTTVANPHAGAIAAGWTKYYGGSQANATLVQGTDFTRVKFQKLSKEANYILYHGRLRKPGNGDFWTESNAANWDTSVINAAWQCTMSDDAGVKVVGANSLEAYCDNAGAQFDFCYPSSKDAAMDLTKIGGEHNIPTVSFYAQADSNVDRSSGLPFIFLGKYTEPGGVPLLEGWQYEFGSFMPTDDKWYTFNLPIGPHWSSAGKEFDGWQIRNNDQWGNVDIVHFKAISKTGVRGKLYIDGLTINGWVLRGARQAAAYSSADPARIKVITDDVGKDDSLVASDDSGTIARLAAAELLRCKTLPTVGFVVTPIIKDLWPGMLLHLHAKPDSGGTFQVDSDFRVVKLVHTFGVEGYFTQSFVTSDVVNSRARAGFDDYNRMMATVRPEFQDRQASSMKARDIDITQAILEKSY